RRARCGVIRVRSHESSPVGSAFVGPEVMAMDRRQFVGAAFAAPLAQAIRPPAATPAVRALMKVGTQHGDSDAILKVLAGFGVNHICSRLPSTRLDEKWSVESLSRFREHVESFGITLDMV